MAIIIVPPRSFIPNGDAASFPNSDTLSKIGSDNYGNLTFNGKAVSDFSREVAFSTTLTQQNILEASLPLPDDCDTSRSITLAIQGIATQKGIDWDILDHSFPELDAIVWDGFGLQFIAQEGDAVIITYYKKI